jgi:hypothetical protein
MNVPDEMVADAVDTWYDAGGLLDDRLRAVLAAGVSEWLDRAGPRVYQAIAELDDAGTSLDAMTVDALTEIVMTAVRYHGCEECDAETGAELVTPDD